MRFFQSAPKEQVALLRRLLPPAILGVVVLYQLLFVRRVHEFGLPYHFAVEILFYGLLGPAVTWGVLAWIERQLLAKEQAEAQARRERRRRERAVAEERARIAREIHEGVAQNLYFLGLQLEMCQRLTRENPQRVEQELCGLQSLLQEAIGDLRRLIWALRPVDLEELGPIEAVRRLAADLEAQIGLKIEVMVRGKEQRLSPKIEGALYRLAQEALNNVAKHAQARHAWVAFELERDWVRVEVRDDGRGFDVASELRAPQGLGLRHLSERVEELGGEFHIDSAPQKGTCLRAVLPLAGRQEGAHP